jgi:BirA family biotin operon repressor/biotin-[acetyl-CoA-carboxylase] ligase
LRGAQVKKSVIGIGININQLEFNSLNATSVRTEINQFIPLMDALFSWIHSFNEEWSFYWSFGRDELEENYLRQLYGMNESVDMEDKNGQFSGTIQGVEKSGKLRVRRGGEILIYDLKELKFIFQNRS